MPKKFLGSDEIQFIRNFQAMINRMVLDEEKHLKLDGRFGPLTHHASNCLISKLDELLQLKEMEKQAQLSELAQLTPDDVQNEKPGFSVEVIAWAAIGVSAVLLWAFFG